MIHRRVRAIVPLFALAATLLLSPGFVGAGDGSQNHASVLMRDYDPALSVTMANDVTREVLGSGLPAAAPGQGLVLLRFTFEPGAVIPTHTHPGMQTAYVVSGTLGYTVSCGQVLATLLPAGGEPPRTVGLGPGPELMLGPGSSIVETEGLVHSGRNAGPGPLVLLVAALLATDRPASSLAEPRCG